MNPDTILQSVQKSFHTTLGAASFVVDLVQQPDQRDANLNRLQTDLNQLMEEWAVKGEQTEQEARTFVETLVNQPGSTSSNAPPEGPVAPPDIQADLRTLIIEISAIRADLENNRESQG